MAFGRVIGYVVACGYFFIGVRLGWRRGRGSPLSGKKLLAIVLVGVLLDFDEFLDPVTFPGGPGES